MAGNLIGGHSTTAGVACPWVGTELDDDRACVPKAHFLTGGHVTAILAPVKTGKSRVRRSQI
ncbi:MULTISPECIES: hypothetical protein [Nocardia]|uniref:hypothetical protein n=1 Tax=Nocardia TaxID=1817 RepID=UPI000D698CD5|nr:MULTISPECIES: hypothetical protein [Nocardia]